MAEKEHPPVSGVKLYAFLGQKLCLKCRDRLFETYAGHRLNICQIETLVRDLRNKQILERYRKGVSVKNLSWEFGVSESTIYNLIRNKI